MATINGTNNNDTLNGTASDDIFNGFGGNDTLNGGTGNNIAIYNGNLADYEFLYTNTTLQVHDLNPANGDDGTDSLSNIQTIQFTDGTISIAPTAEFRVNTTTVNRQ